MGFICDLRVLVRKLARPFGHPTQVSRQVQLDATCDYLRIRLAKALPISIHLRDANRREIPRIVLHFVSRNNGDSENEI